MAAIDAELEAPRNDGLVAGDVSDGIIEEDRAAFGDDGGWSKWAS